MRMLRTTGQLCWSGKERAHSRCCHRGLKEEQQDGWSYNLGTRLDVFHAALAGDILVCCGLFYFREETGKRRNPHKEK